MKKYSLTQIYSFIQHSNTLFWGSTCKEFFARVEKGEIIGYTSDSVLTEVFHKLMIAEVVKKFKKTAKQSVRLIKENPDVIGKLEIIWVEMGLIKKLQHFYFKRFIISKLR